MIVITMATRQTTTITVPTAIPTSLEQLQQELAVSIVAVHVLFTIRIIYFKKIIGSVMTTTITL